MSVDPIRPTPTLKVPREDDFVKWGKTKPIGVPTNVRIMMFHSLGPAGERHTVVAFAPDLETSTPEKTTLRYGVAHHFKKFASEHTGPRVAWDERGRRVRVFDRPDRSADLREWKLAKSAVRAEAIENLWKTPKTLGLDFPLLFPHAKASGAAEQAALLRRTLKVRVVEKNRPKLSVCDGQPAEAVQRVSTEPVGVPPKTCCCCKNEDVARVR
jgi:hypothetical protein